jgi:hypothetical protein
MMANVLGVGYFKNFQTNLNKGDIKKLKTNGNN